VTFGDGAVIVVLGEGENGVVKLDIASNNDLLLLEQIDLVGLRVRQGLAVANE
jgi:hypothetical protein